MSDQQEFGDEAADVLAGLHRLEERASAVVRETEDRLTDLRQDGDAARRHRDEMEESVRQLEVRRTALESDLREVMAELEAARRRADQELAAARRDLATVTAAIEDLDARRRVARQRWHEQLTGMRSRIGEVSGLLGEAE